MAPSWYPEFGLVYCYECREPVAMRARLWDDASEAMRPGGGPEPRAWFLSLWHLPPRTALSMVADINENRDADDRMFGKMYPGPRPPHARP